MKTFFFFAFVSSSAFAWKVDVPVLNCDMARYGGREKVVAELCRAQADCVEVGMGEYELDPVLRARKFAALRENCAALKANGIVPWARTWSFWVGGRNPYTQIAAADGWKAGVFACPADPEFRRMAAGYVVDMARAGAETVILDDDFCYGNRHHEAIVCTCPLHMKRIAAELGEEIAPADLQRRVLSGGPNRWRSAWLKVNGEVLREFAAALRQAMDAYDPKIAIGLCGQHTLWDFDGVDGVTIAKILAGGNRPVLRLISAPYWVTRQIRGFRMQDMFEYNRAQMSWCDPGEVDVFGEGDPYPRPRTACPAAYLELFDLLLHANGGFAGDFKYMMDYFSPVDYEKGYVDRHLRNVPTAKAIDWIFSGKTAVGVRVWESMKKFATAEIPFEHAGSTEYFKTFAPAAGAFLADCGIPTAYEGEGTASIAFGENVRPLTDETFRRGIIIDLVAARILMARGVDVGLRRIGESFKAGDEYFPSEKTYVGAERRFTACRVEVDAKAKVDSEFVFGGLGFDVGKGRSPAAFFYENAKGGRFMVYAFDGVFSGPSKGRSYARARQVRRGVRWLTGKDVPVFTSGNPDVYLLAKRKGDAMAVGVWNLFADEMIEPVVELDEVYADVSFVNCKGRLEGRRVTLSDVAPFSFVGFEVRK